MELKRMRISKYVDIIMGQHVARNSLPFFVLFFIGLAQSFTWMCYPRYLFFAIPSPLNTTEL